MWDRQMNVLRMQDISNVPPLPGKKDKAARIIDGWAAWHDKPCNNRHGCGVKEG